MAEFWLNAPRWRCDWRGEAVLEGGVQSGGDGSLVSRETVMRWQFNQIQRDSAKDVSCARANPEVGIYATSRKAPSTCTCGRPGNAKRPPSTRSPKMTWCHGGRRDGAQLRRGQEWWPTGNPLILERAGIESEIAKLERLARARHAEQRSFAARRTDNAARAERLDRRA